MADVRTAIERVTDLIDELTDPDDMTREEYAEFLDELGGDIEARQSALHEEMGDEASCD